MSTAPAQAHLLAQDNPTPESAPSDEGTLDLDAIRRDAEQKKLPFAHAPILDVGGGILVYGDQRFRSLVQGRLREIRRTSVGADLMAAIASSGRRVLILPGQNAHGVYELNSGAEPVSRADSSILGSVVLTRYGSLMRDANGRIRRGTGKGSDSIIDFNPYLQIGNPLDPNRPITNDVVLAHELIHALHDLQGRTDMTKDPVWDFVEEKNTIETGHPSEKEYLNAIGYPYHRVDHADGFVPTKPAPGGQK
jgi:hypothetical protein